MSTYDWEDIEAPEILKGDFPGHPFRGNQHVSATGGGRGKGRGSKAKVLGRVANRERDAREKVKDLRAGVKVFEDLVATAKARNSKRLLFSAEKSLKQAKNRLDSAEQSYLAIRREQEPRSRQ